MTTLEEILSPLCEAIRDKKQKSKQAAFNSFLPEILKAKKFYSWDQISIYINNETDSSLAVRAYKNMVLRAKKQHSQPESKNENNDKFAPETPTIKQVEKSSIDVDVEPQDLNNYLRVCFNSERIAKRAIEAGVSIEEIKSWKCPNQINLGTKLSNHIQNK
ncbi:hypothetical protein [Pantoea sp. BAV 3049]|uniref:hypothetical protein n=1 Tax=Pantoea sp. BAV 3049 TaxID=2654188 RepID=UPI00131BA771|nr:hypothetical protein [Pantoea sp. BAV 3049]